MKVADGAGEPTLLMRDSGGRDRILHTINEGMGTQPRLQMYGENERKIVELMVDFEDRAIFDLNCLHLSRVAPGIGATPQ
jgi:hypothetical protein